jgi:amidase
LADYPVLLLPVSSELPFPVGPEQGGAANARVWSAQMTRIRLPFPGLPGLTVSAGLHGKTPVAVQLFAGRFHLRRRGAVR